MGPLKGLTKQHKLLVFFFFQVAFTSNDVFDLLICTMDLNGFDGGFPKRPRFVGFPKRPFLLGTSKRQAEKDLQEMWGGLYRESSAPFWVVGLGVWWVGRELEFGFCGFCEFWCYVFWQA